jgi:hypothetical protein
VPPHGVAKYTSPLFTRQSNPCTGSAARSGHASVVHARAVRGTRSGRLRLLAVPRPGSPASRCGRTQAAVETVENPLSEPIAVARAGPNSVEHCPQDARLQRTAPSRALSIVARAPLHLSNTSSPAGSLTASPLVPRPWLRLPHGSLATHPPLHNRAGPALPRRLASQSQHPHRPPCHPKTSSGPGRVSTKPSFPIFNRKAGVCGTRIPVFYTFSTGVDDAVEKRCLPPGKSRSFSSGTAPRGAPRRRKPMDFPGFRDRPPCGKCRVV